MRVRGDDGNPGSVRPPPIRVPGGAQACRVACVAGTRCPGVEAFPDSDAGGDPGFRADSGDAKPGHATQNLLTTDVVTTKPSGHVHPPSRSMRPIARVRCRVAHVQCRRGGEASRDCGRTAATGRQLCGPSRVQRHRAGRPRRRGAAAHRPWPGERRVGRAQPRGRALSHRFADQAPGRHAGDATGPAGQAAAGGDPGRLSAGPVRGDPRRAGDGGPAAQPHFRPCRCAGTLHRRLVAHRRAPRLRAEGIRTRVDQADPAGKSGSAVALQQQRVLPARRDHRAGDGAFPRRQSPGAYLRAGGHGLQRPVHRRCRGARTCPGLRPHPRGHVGTSPVDRSERVLRCRGNLHHRRRSLPLRPGAVRRAPAARGYAANDAAGTRRGLPLWLGRGGLGDSRWAYCCRGFPIPAAFRGTRATTCAQNPTRIA